ncbi:hypothetical protein DICPUDRAFT_15792, partial [Dictyostelium purpureum]
LNSNIKNLDLSSNSLTGPIDYSWCYIDVNFFGNTLLNGALPTCMNCYPDFKTKLGTSFSNLNDKCTSIIPNLRVDTASKKLSLFGRDIGFSGFSTKPFSTTVSIGSASWVADVTNELFTYTGYSTLPGLLYFTFSTNPTQTFTLSTTLTPPVINSFSITPASYNLQLLGSYYSYNTSLVLITIDEKVCPVSSSVFDQINCIIPSSLNIEKTNVITRVCVNSLCTQITINLKGSGTIKACSPLCTSPQYCLSTTGACVCPDGYQGAGCDIPFKSCLNDCNGGLKGVCNNVTGVCTCSDPFNISPDYNLYIGKNCDIANHYISSVEPTTQLGGIVTLGGWFGSINQNITIMIGSNQCMILSEKDISPTEIKCSIPPGTGKHSINMTQNNLAWVGNNLYTYLPIVVKCPNDCNGNGECIDGICFCNNEYIGTSCDIKINNNSNNNNNNNNTNNNNNNNSNEIPKTNNNVNTSTGSIEINNEQDQYTVEIISIIELDIAGTNVREYPLDKKWLFSNKTNSIYQFTQYLKDQNINCIISYQIEEVLSNKNFSFAGINFMVPMGGLKLSLSIKNYSFLSSLNTLQVLISSSIGENENVGKNKCNNQTTVIESDQNKEEEFQTMASITIFKNEKVLIGRFINRAIVDNEKTTLISTSLKEKTNNSIIVSINLPHSRNYLLDPDFSLLVKSNFIQTCNENKKNWLVPVAVVLPTIGAATIGLGAFFLVKK